MSNTELKNKITKAIFKHKLREILTKFGISETEAVELELYVEGETEPEARVTVPTTVKKEHIPSGILSLTSFKQTVKDDFLNQLELPYDGKINVIFSTADENIAVRAGCCQFIGGLCVCYC